MKIFPPCSECKIQEPSVTYIYVYILVQYVIVGSKMFSHIFMNIFPPQIVFSCFFHSELFSFAGNNRRIHVTERIEMGPMTLRDYINTLEPYDPEKHGWRGEEPWRYRIRYKDPPEQSVHVLSEFKTSFNQLNNYQHTNHVVFHETPV